MSGTGWTTFGTFGHGTNQFAGGPYGVFVSADGRIYVTDGGNARIVRINDMSGVGWITFGGRGSGTNQFLYQNGIFMDAGGRIYVADNENSRIVRINHM